MLFFCNGYVDTLKLCCYTLFIIYITLFSIYITLSKFLTSKGFQRSNNNPFIKESGDKKKVISEDKPVKSKEKDNVEGDMNKMNSEDLVVEVSNLIEPPRDKDGKILYDLMSLNTGIYKNGDHPSTVR